MTRQTTTLIAATIVAVVTGTTVHAVLRLSTFRTTMVVSADDIEQYPDTGFQRLPKPPEQVRSSFVERIPMMEAWAREVRPDTVSRVRRLQFQDRVHPDEDLLLGSPNGRATQPTPAGPNTESSQLEREGDAVGEDNVNDPPIEPSRSVPSEPEHPRTDQPTSLEAAREPPRIEQPPFDPTRSPAPDEDLLQGIEPSDGNHRNHQPGEELPFLPPGGRSERLQPRVPPESLAPSRPSYDRRAPTETLPVHPPSMPPALQHAPPPPSVSPAIDPHAEVFADSLYPSAKKCRECHQQIYDEWASSSHAYASISPMFQKFEQTISSLTRGTIGYFCMRCHAPVATALGLPRYDSLIDHPQLGDAITEGVTCVACHRVREQYGKANGERRIEPGDVHDPVYGSGYGEGLAEVLKNKATYKVKTDPHEQGPGLPIHREVIQFEQISDSSFCVSCHQVFVAPGIALEVVWAQYRASPACKLGISCQDCHMGREPGVAAGYDNAPVAIVNDKPVSPERKHSNHVFYGPGYSIAHPGIFPFTKDAEKWNREAWLNYDWRAGWGTDPFEDAVRAGQLRAAFPPEWEDAEDRYDAREVVDKNLKKLSTKKQMRRRLYENSSHVEGPIFDTQARAGKPLKFHYVVSNTSLGHNLPSGSLGAQPQLWLNVALSGPDGRWLWESGYVDANGDICDLHSLEVAAGRAPRDQQLFNLQTKFLITSVKGTDREMYLPVNTDLDQLPFIRPSAFPVTVMNHPPFIRMEAHSIPALGSRRASYKVPGNLLQQRGKYRLSVRMRSRAEPIYFMRFCNATPEMERGMNEWMLDFHEHATEFWIE